MKRSILTLCLLMAVLMMFACSKQEPVAPENTQTQESPFVLGKEGQRPLGEMSDEELIALMEDANAWLEDNGYDIRVAQLEFYTQGRGRPDDGDGTGRVVRILQQPFRWAANDPRRDAQGDDITYIIDDANGTGPTSLGNVFPSAAIRSAMETWDQNNTLDKVDLVERPSPAGLDITIFDGDFPVNFCPGSDLPGNGLANFTAADIVIAGWYPASCFAFNTLAFSVTFTFGGDANGDGYTDTALNEVYYNDAWGNPNLPPLPPDGDPDPREDFPWDLNQNPLPSIDVRTVSFHELGHSLGVGHFGPPPDAVMNPVYAGPRISTFPIDEAGMATIWERWPN